MNDQCASCGSDEAVLHRGVKSGLCVMACSAECAQMAATQPVGVAWKDIKGWRMNNKEKLERDSKRAAALLTLNTMIVKVGDFLRMIGRDTSTKWPMEDFRRLYWDLTDNQIVWSGVPALKENKIGADIKGALVQDVLRSLSDALEALEKRVKTSKKSLGELTAMSDALSAFQRRLDSLVMDPHRWDNSSPARATETEKESFRDKPDWQTYSPVRYVYVPGTMIGAWTAVYIPYAHPLRGLGLTQGEYGAADRVSAAVRHQNQLPEGWVASRFPGQPGLVVMEKKTTRDLSDYGY